MQTKIILTLYENSSEYTKCLLRIREKEEVTVEFDIY